MTCCKTKTYKKQRYDSEGVILHDDEKNIVENLDFPTPDEIRDKMAAPFKEMGDKITGGFTDAFKKFKDFGDALKHIFDGIGDIFTATFTGIHDGFEDIGLLFRYFGLFLQTHLYCGIKFIRNFTHCVIYYIIDAFLRTLYLPFTIAFWVSKNVFNIDMGYIEDEMWDNLWILDGYVFSTFQVHVLMWPLNVRNDCYNCTRMKVSAMERIAHKIDADFRGIGTKIDDSKIKIRDGGREMRAVFS